MSFRLNMSAGEFFELIRPAVMIVSALVSTWVLASARKRFLLYQSIAWAAGTLLFPSIVFPLYLVAIMAWSHPRRSPVRWRFALPLLYATIVLSAIAAFVYRDNRSIDAHLARASRAKLADDKATTIREYQEALALEDNAHTHKLLAIELERSGYWGDAISEYRLAEKGGEPDDSISFRLGLLLEHLNQEGQARLEFQKFLLSETCQGLDMNCERARQKLADGNQ